MNGIGAAFRAIGGGFGDVFSGRLGGLALLCLIVALTATIGAAWAAFHYLLPMIPDGAGWMAWVWNAAEFLGGAGIVVLAIVLAPAVSMIVGGALFDVAAERVEKRVFPAAPRGRMVPLHEGLWNGLKIAAPALVLNVISLPLLFVPVVNLVWFLSLNGFLMGREYAALAAVRRMNWREAQALRRRAPLAVFVVGLACSVIPFVAPLIGAGAMTRLVMWISSNTNSPRAA